jgi:hypothetical protein
MSALKGKPEVNMGQLDFCFWHFSDMADLANDVCFRENSGCESVYDP